MCFSGDGSGCVFEDMMYSRQLCFFFFCLFVCFFFLFFCFVFFFLFFFSVLKFRFKGKQGTVRSDLITVLRTVRSDHSSHKSLLFSHRAVLEAKRIAKMSDSRFSRSDYVVRSRFQNLDLNQFFGLLVGR